MTDFVISHLDHPHPMWIVSNLTTNGSGDDELHVFEKASGVPVIVSAEDLVHASVMELLQHLGPDRFIHVEVVFAFIRSS